MRLKQIKLAGFKSFVDATKIPFKQQMTAIVGPNGCGKSNIIDAVRWVLGESSAKNLRGDAMTDVIFNGSSSRKPIGQASVELVFENTQGKLQGSLADRNEVSIRRVVTRDATSTYYLNGSKCRRRDITDIFLGTGLGPRSYAIIEQGTISRLIESKPQELRVFIEEAAGISKYKEKRRETENRIRHTRENLERLTDIIAELTHQIDKLHQQAEAAKRFKTLKTRERKYKAELAAMRWQQFEQKSQHYLQQMKSVQLRIENLVMQQRQTELDIVKTQESSRDSSEKVAEYQQQKLKLSNDITRLEQNIKHKKQQQLAQQQQLTILAQEQQSLEQLLTQEKQHYQQFSEQLQAQQPELEILALQLEQSQFSLQDQQEALQQCLQQWQQVNENIGQYQALLASLEAKLHAQQQALEQAEKALEKSTAELEQFQPENEQEKAALLANIELLKQQQCTKKTEQEKLAQKLTLEQDKYNAVQTQHYKQKAQLQALTAQLTQLELQQKKQPDWYKNQQHFLQQKIEVNVEQQAFEHIVINEKWQKALTSILGYWLNAGVIEDFTELFTYSSLPETLLLIKPSNAVESITKGTLAEQLQLEKMHNAAVFFPLLNKIYCAENLTQAQHMLTQLAADESIVCSDGTWLSPYFFRKGTIDVQEDVLQRQTQIEQLKAEIRELSNVIEKEAANLLEIEARITGYTQAHEIVTQALSQNLAEFQQQQQQLALIEQAAQHNRQQLAQLQMRQAQDEANVQHHQQQLKVLQEQLAQLQQEHQVSDENNLALLSDKKERLQQEILTLQSMVQQFQQQYHQLSLAVEKATLSQENSQEKISQTQQQLMRLTEKINELAQYHDNKDTLESETAQLQQLLTQMSELEQKLTRKQSSLAKAQSHIEQLQQRKTQLLTDIDTLKTTVNQHYLDSENYQLRAQGALEQLAEMQQNLDDVLANMPKEAKETTWQGQISRISKEIAQLGAINLAAIDEYEQELTRKSFLDQQYQDLTAAIATLENAIAKIDRQTRQKFKATFEQINDDFKQLFPHVFGGGSAYLALTGDDLLETGVTIMARPPGKKNSTIHLLSGGEKALTALSLVFAIFRLNPAPFCMLDEVDAPLDDANVVRFCNLVREMSQSVQFIYISHNKIAMEMASHLTGVTMFEPGVSRMVAVDIDEAIAMAEMSA